ncbi:hypothetical protein E1262_28325 [Jiangella aurantiaca]|uniref:Uncharacterized protein n=1 Tax=Jiangella aurantiaca TaxID=2530373 RepID=A0A4R5A1B1_9ACTN|nr:hypothetical protein E1262_28325 [Jiangella aurantiaca]
MRGPSSTGSHHPRPAKQRTYYAKTRRYLAPLAAVDPRLATLFADWERTYQHLDWDAAMPATDDA